MSSAIDGDDADQQLPGTCEPVRSEEDDRSPSPSAPRPTQDILNMEDILSAAMHGTGLDEDARSSGTNSSTDEDPIVEENAQQSAPGEVDDLEYDLDFYDHGDEVDEFVPQMVVGHADFDETDALFPAEVKAIDRIDITDGGVPRATSLQKQRLGPARCQDVVPLLLFVITTVVIIVLEAIDLGEHPIHAQVTEIMLFSSFVSALLGVLCLMVWTWVTQQLLWGMQVSSCMAVMALAVFHFMFAGGFWQVGLIAMAAGGVIVLWLYISAKDKLQFAVVTFDMVSGLVKENASLLTVTGAMLFIQLLWLFVFVLAAIQATKFEHFGLLYLVLVFAFYWTTQVFKHIVHVSISGTISHWYFRLPASRGRDSITFMCLRRALTYYLGSICLGSLTVAILRVLWVPLRLAVETKNQRLLCLFSRPYYAVEALHARFNKFGFSPVILYGEDFGEASVSTWKRMRACGVDSIIAQDKVTTLLLIPALGGAALVGAFAASWADYRGIALWPEISIFAFFIGFASISLAGEIVEATCTTIYSCFAEQPQNLAESHPLIFHRFVRISEFSTFRSRRMNTL